ncbi:MAG TPA: hydrogenase maturation protease [Solirubrobacterales bacterium]|jgi:hydrogenase maturation protease
MSAWEELERPAPDAVEIDGVAVRRGSRVLLRPAPGGDVFDVALADQVAVVEAIEQDMEEQILLAVVVEDDPGRDLGQRRQPGHRFFFDPAEVEPLGEAAATAEPEMRVLVAGIGNVFLGDDGFGVALANRLAASELPAGVEVVDFGIRGIDLAWAMQDGYDAVVLLDATPRGSAPGTLYLIEPEVEPGAHPIEGHGMDPVTVLSLVHALGGTPPRTLVVGCEPLTRIDPDDESVVADLSEPVRLALDEGMKMVDSLLAELTAPKQEKRSPP